ncbi:MAG: hypothetical protein ABIQ77_00745 [Anaerolineales bacterium]
MVKYKFNLFADYFQFYLQDEQAASDLSKLWTEQAVKDLLALAPSTIGIRTLRNMTVPVIVEINDSAPKEQNFDRWDHVNECSINISSGCIVIMGSTDYFPNASRIENSPSWYRARIYYEGLDTISEDGLKGDDHYKIVLWSADEANSRVIKRNQSNTK